MPIPNYCSVLFSALLLCLWQRADRWHAFIELLQANLSTEYLKLPMSTKANQVSKTNLHGAEENCENTTLLKKKKIVLLEADHCLVSAAQILQIEI